MTDTGGFKPNVWRRVEGLESVWERAKRSIVTESSAASEPGPGVVLNLTRRTRTPLTDEKVDAVRIARATRESIMPIAKRFGILRMTVWKRPLDTHKACPVSLPPARACRSAIHDHLPKVTSSR